MQARAPFLWQGHAVLAVWMREAWALRDARSDIGDQRKDFRQTRRPQSLAVIRQGREVEKEHVAQEVERLHDKELEQEREATVRHEL